MNGTCADTAAAEQIKCVGSRVAALPVMRQPLLGVEGNFANALSNAAKDERGGRSLEFCD